MVGSSLANFTYEKSGKQRIRQKAGSRTKDVGGRPEIKKQNGEGDRK